MPYAALSSVMQPLILQLLIVMLFFVSFFYDFLVRVSLSLHRPGCRSGRSAGSSALFVAARRYCSLHG